MCDLYDWFVLRMLVSFYLLVDTDWYCWYLILSCGLILWIELTFGEKSYWQPDRFANIAFIVGTRDISSSVLGLMFFFFGDRFATGRDPLSMVNRLTVYFLIFLYYFFCYIYYWLLLFDLDLPITDFESSFPDFGLRIWWDWCSAIEDLGETTSRGLVHQTSFKRVCVRKSRYCGPELLTLRLVGVANVRADFYT